jgi:4'-phosphopantetheinyl transferase
MNNSLKLYEIDLQADICSDLFDILSPEEQTFALTIRNETIKKQHITVRVAVRQILASYLNQASDKIHIAKTAHGKPYLADYPDCQFNISHSGSLLLVVISQLGQVGIDIEQAKPQLRDFSGLVGKCFAASEQTYWNGLPDNEKSAEFYQFWTRKEAFVKAVGHGLSMGVQHCVIACETPAYFVSVPAIYGDASNWQLFDLSLPANLYGALVIASHKIPRHFCLPEITPFIINQAR